MFVVDENFGAILVMASKIKSSVKLYAHLSMYFEMLLKI